MAGAESRTQPPRFTALARVRCESTETSVRNQQLLFARAVVRQEDNRLPKWAMTAHRLVGGTTLAGQATKALVELVEI